MQDTDLARPQQGEVLSIGQTEESTIYVEYFDAVADKPRYLILDHIDCARIIALSKPPQEAQPVTDKPVQLKDNDSYFNSVWSQYPNKLGRKAALRHFKATVKSTDDYRSMIKAMNNFLSSKVCKGDPQFIPHGSTWFNNWQDWIEYKEPVTESVQQDKTADIQKRLGLRT